MSVELLSNWGTDLDVVNNAKVSFNRQSEWASEPDQFFAGGEEFIKGSYELSKGDKNLIRFLARGVDCKDWEALKDSLEVDLQVRCEDLDEVLYHLKSLPTHWAPFANGIGARFHIKAPIPIMRQLFKHKVGSVESEVSRRYVSGTPEVFHPTWRQKAENVKQGSGGPLSTSFKQASADMVYQETITKAIKSYEFLLELGVCPEQARFVLPQGVLTEAIISNSLYGWANLCRQRNDPHAQAEVRDIAAQIDEIGYTLWPVSWAALKGQTDQETLVPLLD